MESINEQFETVHNDQESIEKQMQSFHESQGQTVLGAGTQGYLYCNSVGSKSGQVYFMSYEEAKQILNR